WPTWWPTFLMSPDRRRQPRRDLIIAPAVGWPISPRRSGSATTSPARLLRFQDHGTRCSNPGAGRGMIVGGCGNLLPLLSAPGPRKAPPFKPATTARATPRPVQNLYNKQNIISLYYNIHYPGGLRPQAESRAWGHSKPRESRASVSSDRNAQ